MRTRRRNCNKILPTTAIAPNCADDPCQTAQIHSDYLVSRLRLLVSLRVKGGGELELDAGHGEELALEVSRERRVPVSDNGVRDVVQLDDSVEEGVSHGHSCVRVAEGNEVRHLRESIDHCEDDRFAMDLGQILDEVKRNVGPDHGGHLQWLQQPRRLQLLCLVLLAG
jgi:hypothetical protein